MMDSSKNTEFQDNDKVLTFESLGVQRELCEICKELGWEKPTVIQQQAVPAALQGRDIIGLAQTGSGKTGAFAIPIVQALMKTPQRTLALILTPTRELAFQVSKQFEALGASIKLTTAVIVGGIEMMTQNIALAKRPHIIVATPGRLVDHLENTKGFSLKLIKFLVLDEADRMLNKDFEQEFDKILKALPKERHTYLYSATMTHKVKKLQKACLKYPVRVEIFKKPKTVDGLDQYVLSVPFEHRAVYLVHILFKLPGKSVMIFCETCSVTNQMYFILKSLGFSAFFLHRKLNQEKRLAVIEKFTSKKNSILVTTDVASRGLDIPHVDIVINYDKPFNRKNYIHRVGRAGREGKSITFKTQYDEFFFSAIQSYISEEIKPYPIVADDVMVLKDQVREAKLFAFKKMRKQERERKKRHPRINL